jgi:streptogramin lyase
MLTDALPTVDARGRVFLADQRGRLFRVERAGGEATATLLWSSPTGQAVFGEVVIDTTGVLYFADYAGAIYGVAGNATD